MTIGIYALIFNDKIYVGQSINIERRYKSHCTLLYRNAHFNYKIQREFNIYNIIPELQILEICSSQELDCKEISWINEFDSINSGLNILVGGKSSYGENHPAAKHRLAEYIEVVHYLAYTNLTYKEINSITDISISVITNISAGNKHQYLEALTDAYRIMLSKIGTRCTAKSTGKVYPLIISPDGEIFEVENTSAFCKKYNLHTSHLNAVFTGKRLSHKGWKLYNGIK